MQIDENRKMLFSDTLVPDIFITDYMSALSGLSVKVYIYILLSAREKKEISTNDLAVRFGRSPDDMKASLTELASYRLIDFNNDGFVINDIKSMEMKKIYGEAPSLQTKRKLNEKEASEREKMLSDIGKTFFSGIMSPSWYYEIDSWFEQYRFEPEVVYALFNECMRRKKLDSKAYISKVASNWSKEGIVTYDDLNKYFMKYDKVMKLSNKIGQKLKKSITEYDEEIVSSWVNKMCYDFDIIEIALKKTSKLKNPNLEYANKLLEEWFSKGLTTASQINDYEKEKQAKFFSDKKDTTNNNPKNNGGNVANFNQRVYSDEYHEQFIEDVTKQTGN